MTADVVPVVTPEGEIVEPGEVVARLTPGEARQLSQWVRDVTAAALVEGVDYGKLPDVDKPALFKSGAEMLILVGGLRFDQIRIEDDAYREHEGALYRCEIRRRGSDELIAVCEAYAGFDEKKFVYRYGRAPWNTVLKMAQKRALVGAALNAVGGSGLFAADVDDDDGGKDRGGNDRGGGGKKTGDNIARGRTGTPPSRNIRTETVDERTSTLTADERVALDDWLDEKNYPAPPYSSAVTKAVHEKLDEIIAARPEVVVPDEVETPPCEVDPEDPGRPLTADDATEDPPT